MLKILNSNKNLNFDINVCIDNIEENLLNQDFETFFFIPKIDKFRVECIDTDFLDLNEEFVSMFGEPIEEEVIEEEIVDIFEVNRKDVSFDFKKLNQEFSLFFQTKDEIVVEEEQVLEKVLDFSVSLCEENLNNKSYLNDSFENLFVEFVEVNESVLENDTFIKMIKIDLEKREKKPKKIERKLEDNAYSDFIFSSSHRIKEEITEESNNLINREITKIKEEYDQKLEDELSNAQKIYQENLDDVKKDNDKKIEKIVGEFNTFKKMVLEQVRGLKSSFLSSVSGGGAINFLDLFDVKKEEEIVHGGLVRYDGELKKFVVDPPGTGGNQQVDFFTVDQDMIDAGFIQLSEEANPEFFNSSKVEINGLANLYPVDYNFIGNDKIDSSRLILTVGDTLRIVYTKL